MSVGDNKFVGFITIWIKSNENKLQKIFRRARQAEDFLIIINISNFNT
jgi:hypothetical protein